MNSFSRGTAWAITPEAYDEAAKNHDFFIRSDDLQIEASKYNYETGEYSLDIRGGVAVVTIRGSIVNRGSFFSYLYGSAVIPAIKAEIEQAVVDRQISSILLDIDSPGGTVSGVSDLSDYIKGLDIPVVAYSGGNICSAAMWVGSAADKVVIDKTSSAGSIGVLIVHQEFSKAAKDNGVNFTVLRSGKYKATGNPYEPLSDTAKDTLQAEIDYIYSIFVDTIAKNRGVSIDDALAMADGKVFIGQQAMDIGLVDKIGSFEYALEVAQSMGDSAVKKSFSFTGNAPRKDNKMSDVKTMAELEAAFPDLVKQIKADAVEAVDVAGPVKAESGRVIALAEIQFKDDGKFKALVDSGVTVEQLTAIKAMEPEAAAPAQTANETPPDVSAEMLEQIKKASAADPGNGGGDDDSAPKTFTAAWKSIKKDDPELTNAQAMSQASADYPELYAKQREGA